MTDRRRVAVFGALVVACLVGAAVVVIATLSSDSKPAGSLADAQSAFAAARKRGPALVFAASRKTGAQLAVAPAGQAGGKATLAPMSCDRVYYRAGRGLCLVRG